MSLVRDLLNKRLSPQSSQTRGSVPPYAAACSRFGQSTLRTQRKPRRSAKGAAHTRSGWRHSHRQHDPLARPRPPRSGNSAPRIGSSPSEYRHLGSQSSDGAGPAPQTRPRKIAQARPRWSPPRRVSTVRLAPHAIAHRFTRLQPNRTVSGCLRAQTARAACKRASQKTSCGAQSKGPRPESTCSQRIFFVRVRLRSPNPSDDPTMPLTSQI
jgi:hypothetical protein